MREQAPTAVVRVFIASTTDDLAEHREAVIRVLEGLDMLPVRVHHLGAEARSSVVACQDHAAGADALVVIAGHLYGWIPTRDQDGDGERSITWLEMAAARRAGRPVFGFVPDDGAPWDGPREQDRLLKARSAEEAGEVWRAVEQLARFKAEITAHAHWRFRSPEHLATGVVLSLVRHFRPAASEPATTAPVAPDGSVPPYGSTPVQPPAPVLVSPRPEGSPGGISVVNNDSRIGNQVVARRIDGLHLEARIEQLVHRLLEQAQ